MHAIINTSEQLIDIATNATRTDLSSVTAADVAGFVSPIDAQNGRLCIRMAKKEQLRAVAS